MSEQQIAAAVEMALSPPTCPMDADPGLNQCPHDACWFAQPPTCQAFNPTTPATEGTTP